MLTSIQNNTFFVCEDYYLFLFETENGARDADLLGYFPDKKLIEKGLSNSVAWWSTELKEKVTRANPGELVYLLDRIDKWWHVIIGERIGWIIAEDWLSFKTYSTNDNMVK